ncbi:PREDICTED: U-box domain-containing protein 40 [Fragaria vesca subsp. vesca]|uniref:U-box domain-containing protein 40 n=1 Tax=Fragaria vesca subsp. vesca TaxID=101020 RepID=UPI0002C2E22D|nr:PREDICTED: U-box domain-containing protein 40 [Fragaria vesca subsp. vesca]
MEFKEGLLRLVVQKSKETNTIYVAGDRLNEITTTARSPSRRWKLFHRSSSAIPSKPISKPQIPTEFICPISGSLMSDPVIVSSGHTFERVCVQLCKALDFTPHLVDSPPPDFTSIIPNLALKSTIINWCRNYSIAPPTPPDPVSAEKLVRASCDRRKVSVSDNESLIRGVEETPKVNFNHAATEVTRRKTHFHSSSDESVSAAALTPPLPFSTQPSCYSSRSSSSSEIETLTNPNEEEDGILAGLRSTHVSEIEAALTSLRRITRTREDARAHLCSPRLLSALKTIVVSRYINIQVNSVAALVNLSLEKSNKIKIVRSGILPPLIDVLKGGSAEAQEHASGVVFSLALDDDCKTAIGVLGALPPLLNLLNSESERTRHDSALGLYHLTLVQSNRSKLVKLGAVPVLLRMVKSGHMVGRVLLILGNLSWCGDGRAAMLDSGGVECLVGVLRGNEMDSRSSQESCVAALYGLSHGGLRFKGLAKAAGAVEVLREVEKSGSERGREKARRMLEMMRGREKEEEEEVDWEELLDSGLGSRTRFQLGCGGLSGSCVNSSEF